MMDTSPRFAVAVTDPPHFERYLERCQRRERRRFDAIARDDIVSEHDSVIAAAISAYSHLCYSLNDVDIRIIDRSTEGQIFTPLDVMTPTHRFKQFARFVDDVEYWELALDGVVMFLVMANLPHPGQRGHAFTFRCLSRHERVNQAAIAAFSLGCHHRGQCNIYVLDTVSQSRVYAPLFVPYSGPAKFGVLQGWMRKIRRWHGRPTGLPTGR